MPSAEKIAKKYQLTPTENFAYLREQGLKYIQELSGKLWSDHNLHDPGITILEVLCYALIDLGYRSNFDMKDLVAEKDGTVDTTGSFHTARDIFTTKPVTINDYRKLLIDIPGVRNAWLFVQDTQKKPFDEGIHLYAYCKESSLIYEAQISSINLNDQDHVRNNERVYIKGIYSVKLELDEHPLYGDLNSSIVSVKIVRGELAGYQLEASFPDWVAKDQNNKDLVSMFQAAKIDDLKIELVNDTKLLLKDFLALKRSQFQTKWTIKYGSEERILNMVTIKVIKAPPVANGLVKAEALQNAVNDNNASVGFEALKRYRQRPDEIFKTFSVVRHRLMECRNLCEDFLHSMNMVDTEDLVICTDMDVNTNADLESIQAQAYALIENYLLPPVQFSTLKDLLDKDVPVEDIFNGPQLQHGFLTDEAVKTADLRSEYYTSDIISLLMDINGVQNVRNFQFNVYGNSVKKRGQPDDWRIVVSANHKLRLNREKCKLLFFKNGLPLNANFTESVNKLRLMQTLQNHLKYKYPVSDLPDLPVPTGRYRNLDKHYPIINEFPKVYGLGEKDLPDNVSNERKGQVKQLEAYLTFFDQLIANYFGQLEEVKNLLSWKANLKNTYSSKYFYKDADAEQLFKDYNLLAKNIDDSYLSQIGLADNKQNKPQRDFLKAQTGLEHLTETYSVFLDRRNRLLDHLISRFAESFNDYAINMYALPDEMVISDDEVSVKLITDKINLLNKYPSLSSARGGGFNYSLIDDNPLRTANLSGYARRIRSLLGMEIDQIKPLNNIADDDFGGFHLVEHLLLRPVKDGDQLLSVCLNDNCGHCGDEDPYSFKVSVILPFWPKRFKSMHFRNYMESLFRSEAPAHVFLKICWVDKKEMALFEIAYSDWINAKESYYRALPLPPADIQQSYSHALGSLIVALEGLRTDFPAATLHDCVDRDEENDTRVFLNHTALGEYKNITEDDPG